MSAQPLDVRRPLGHREVFALAWPILVSMLSYNVMTVADSIFVGRLGTAPLAAIGLSASLVYLGTSFGNGLLGGARVLVARSTGAGDRARAHAVAWQALWVAVVMGVLVMSLVPLIPAALSVMGASETVAPLATHYAVIRTLGAPVVFASVALMAWFQGRGDTRTPMVATVLANVINVALDPLLIFGAGPVPALGLDGAALATVIGIAAQTAVLAVAGHRLLRAPVLPDVALLRRVWAIGAPMGTQYLLDVLSFTGFAALLAWAGDAHLAAHVIVVRIILVSFLPCHAISEAAGVLVGQSLGAGLRERARTAWRLASVQGVAIMVAFGLLFVTVPDLLTGVFGADEAVRLLARQVLLLYAAVQVIDALATVAIGSLMGAGDTRFVMWLSVGSAWLVKLPVAALLVFGLGMGVLGAWLGLAAELGALMVFALWRVRGHAWLEHREPELDGDAVPAK